MSKSKSEYCIVLKSNRIHKNWLALQAEFPDRVADLKKFLKSTPADRRLASGKLKKLKGAYKGILQYDITKNDARVWYRIDRSKSLVIILYAGHHPNW